MHMHNALCTGECTQLLTVTHTQSQSYLSEKERIWPPETTAPLEDEFNWNDNRGGRTLALHCRQSLLWRPAYSLNHIN